MSAQLADLAIDKPAAPVEPEPEIPSPSSADRRFDFRHPVFLSSAQWRKIRAEIDEFAESVGTLLSTYLRLDFGVQVARLDTATLNDFTSVLPSTTHLTLFRLEPLRGVSVIEVQPGIGLGIVDRLLGGPGLPATLDRTLTEMEVALLDQLVQLVLGEWCKQWNKVHELRAGIFGHESNPRFLQSSGGDTVMLLLTLDARMGECLGQMQIAIPYHAFEPVLEKLIEAVPDAPPPQKAAPALKWNRSFDALPIRLKAQCSPFKVPARDLLNLKTGDVLFLQQQTAEQIEIRAGNVTKFRGRLGTRDEKWAIQITEVARL